MPFSGQCFLPRTAWKQGDWAHFEKLVSHSMSHEYQENPAQDSSAVAEPLGHALASVVLIFLADC